MSDVSMFATELRSQPSVWRKVAAVVSGAQRLFPANRQRVCVIGCGTSLYMGQSYAAYREHHGGETDAFPASEAPIGRRYDLVIALSRSGTTTEVLEAVEDLRRQGTSVLAITAAGDSPLTAVATGSVVLDFADEGSVVQSRFATSALQLMLAGCGWDVEASAIRAEKILVDGPPPEIAEASQFVFLGRGMAVGLANEAALKLRESAQLWTEAYPSMEFRHGPISTVGGRTVVWSVDPIDRRLAAEIEAIGSSVVSGEGDPIAELVRVHLAAEQLAASRGLNPDAPMHLSRSVVLER